MIAAHAVPFVLQESITLNVLQSRLHGLDHWFRVWQNAQLLNGLDKGANMEVVALFALFHDSMRINDGRDPEHGYRGYKLWERFHRTQPELDRYFSDRQHELLFEACVEHNNGGRSTDPTIAICWDADRLDLPRVSIWPDAQYMSTQAAINLTITKITK